MLQESLDHPHYTASDNQGLQYIPSTPFVDGTVSIGEAYHTHQSLEGPNITWDVVKYNWTRGTNTSPASFETIVSLEGITPEHDVELIGEHVYTSCSSPATTPTTITGSFDLLSSASQPPIYRTSPGTVNGQIKVELPFRWKYIENIALDCYTNFDDASPTLTATPSTSPGDEDTYVMFTTPVGWTNGLYCTVAYNEYGNYTYSPNPVQTNAKNTLKLGYDGLDKYGALRIHVETTADPTYDVKFNSFNYRYKIL